MDLSNRDIDLLVEAFCETSDPAAIAEKIGATPELVKVMLDDPSVAERAMKRKLSKLGVVFAGKIIDRLTNIALQGQPQQSLAAIKLLDQRLGTAPKVGRPSSKKEPEGPDYEEVLREMDGAGEHE